MLRAAHQETRLRALSERRVHVHRGVLGPCGWKISPRRIELANASTKARSRSGNAPPMRWSKKSGGQGPPREIGRNRPTNSIIQKAPQLARPRRVLQLAQCLGLDLTDTFARHR